MKLELRGITKVFGSLIANDGIDLTVESGEIHALLGENGAGKSTLMNVLYGLYRPDAGQILLDGTPVRFRRAGDAVAAGIGMVHQHFMLVPIFTVAESVALGYEPARALGVLNRARARARVLELNERFGFDLDPDAHIEDLPVGAQQQVEIMKALSRDARILILDEPTAVLTPQEIDDLMATMRSLKRQGTSIVFITHKLREVRAVADTITVIRRGRVVGQATPETSEQELASLMVGRAVALGVTRETREAGRARLQIEDVSALGESGRLVLDHVSLAVRAGEVVCVAGVQGNGQTELAQAILGSLRPESGRVRLDGRDVTDLPIAERLAAGLGFIPEDRAREGLIAGFSIAENLVLDVYNRAPYASGGSMRPGVVRRNAVDRCREFDVRVTSVDDPIATLSGGNQQKAILARELSRPVAALVASQPTRGLDVGSIEFVHRRIIAERDQGRAVLVVSSELDEVVGLADRIAVMYRGHVVGIVGPDTPRPVLGLMMAGVPQEEARAQAGLRAGASREAQ